MCHLIGLHRLDDTETPPSNPSLRDWTDIEGGRRLFWHTFAMDRYSAVITGKPMIVHEDDVRTVSYKHTHVS